MSAFRRTPNFSLEEIKKSQEQILHTLERGGLNPETTLIIGGAALTLAGIRPASEVDTIILKTDFDTTRARGRTPGGLLVRDKPLANQPFLETFDSPTPYEIDMTHPTGLDNHYHPGLDNEFLRTIQKFQTVEGYRFLPPDIVMARKKLTKRRKDRRDVRLIERHLKRTE